MTTPLARSVHKQRQAIRRWLPKRRDDSGLTTLEWLLIVAAVAGLAALAVVLVQRVVGDTSEQIAGSSARATAARVAGLSVQDEAKNYDANLDRFESITKWDNYFPSKCNSISVTFADAGVTATAAFEVTSGGAVTDVTAASDASAALNRPQAQCAVS